jgi:hypothetical protein
MEDLTVDFENLYKPVSKTEDELNNPVTKSLQDQEVKMYLARKNKLRQNKNKIWGLLIGQCSAALASVIEHKSEYRKKDKANDVLWLLNEIKQVSSGLDMKCNRRYMYHEALLMFITMKQGDTESLDAWMNRIESNCQNLIMAGGEHVLSSPQLMPNGGLHATDEEIKEEAQKFKAMVAIKRSNYQKFGTLQQELVEATHVGRDEYTETPAAAYDLLVRRDGLYSNRPSGGGNHSGNGRGSGRNDFRGVRERSTNVMFVQRGDGDGNCAPVAGTDGNIVDAICYRCNTPGHISRNCPNRTRSTGRTGTNCMQIGLGFAQGDDCIPSTWILLDTCSMASVSNNEDLVCNIHTCEPQDELTVFTNGGSKLFKKRGTLRLFPLDVHFNKDSMATIVSMKDLASLANVRIHMDSHKERAIFVDFGASTFKFQECQDGLYYYDTASKATKPKDTVSNYSLLSTVAANKEFYTSNEIKGANSARALQQTIGWPSTSTFKTIIKHNLIRNSSVTIDDINRAELIYGTATPLLQGKMTRIHPPQAKITKIPLPLPISENHKHLQLYIDFFFINGIPFLHTKSGKVNFITAQTVTSRSQRQIINNLEAVKTSTNHEVSFWKYITEIMNLILQL